MMSSRAYAWQILEMTIRMEVQAEESESRQREPSRRRSGLEEEVQGDS